MNCGQQHYDKIFIRIYENEKKKKDKDTLRLFQKRKQARKNALTTIKHLEKEEKTQLSRVHYYFLFVYF